MAQKFYRLGGKASAFFDPQQSVEENKFLNVHEAKPLDLTARVLAAKKGDGLIELTEEEAKSFLNDAERAELALQSKGEKALASADKKLEEAKILKKQAENTEKLLKESQGVIDELGEENKTLKEALSDPTKNDALKKALEEVDLLKGQLEASKKPAK